MLKKLPIMILVLFIIASCGNKQKTDETAKMTVAEITANTSDYVGKKISVTGTVVHVCKHGGKRMFIIGDEPEPRFKITAGENIGVFDIALEGSDVVAHGVIQAQKIDEEFLNNWEAEFNMEHDAKDGDAEHLHGQAREIDDHHENTEYQIRSLRKQIAENGGEAIYFYSLECESFEEI